MILDDGEDHDEGEGGGDERKEELFTVLEERVKIDACAW